VKTIEITGKSGQSKIVIGESIRNLERYLPPGRAVIVTDHNVRHYYEKDFPDWPIIEIGCGEGIKTLDTVQAIYRKLLELGADRSNFLIGIGGGVVCDIAGFAASTFLRGIRFGFVSSTLLAQVDASVGGKNGVNFKAYKNMVGTFNQPDFVICDIHLLATLPEEERLNGFAEIVKHAAIADARLFAFLENNYRQALTLDFAVLERLVFDSVSIKAAIVNRDEQERGERRKLNFGHTLGHALEKTTGIAHGQAVSIGMAAAADLSVKRGLLPAAEADRLRQLLKNFKLPVSAQIDRQAVLDAIGKDKKRQGSWFHFVLLNRLGEAVVEEIAIDALEDVLDDLCVYQGNQS
jgi:3-dehydroquinate synthase